MIPLSKQYIATLKDAAKKLTGEKRRVFEAKVTLDYFNSKPYLAEQTLGWDRKTIEVGINELRKHGCTITATCPVNLLRQSGK